MNRAFHTQIIGLSLNQDLLGFISIPLIFWPQNVLEKMYSFLKLQLCPCLYLLADIHNTMFFCNILTLSLKKLTKFFYIYSYM